MRYFRKQLKSGSRTLHVNRPLAAISKIDIWLPRLSHIAQFGLFIFTVGTIYFTVIPLYQKALLDEAIAKKEVELKQVSIQLDTSYARVRTMVLKEFIFLTTVRCSRIMPSEKLSQESTKKGILPGQYSVLTVQMHDCLFNDEDMKRVMLDLRPADQEHLAKKLVEISASLDRVQKIALGKFSAVDEKHANQYAGPLPGSYQADFLSSLKSMSEKLELIGAPKIDYEKRRREVFASVERQRIEIEFATEVRTQLRTLLDTVAATK